MKHKLRKNMLYAPCFGLREIKGQFLIESMVAIGIIILGLLSILALFSRSLSLNRVISDQFTAAYLGAEGVEVVKNLLDGNYIQNKPEWNAGFDAERCYEVDYNTLDISAATPATCPDGSANPLEFDRSTGRYSYGAGVPTSFYRTIHITPVDPNGNEIRVNSIVKWNTRGGGSFKVNFEDHFFNWRP